MENTSKQWEAAEIQLMYKSHVKPSERPHITCSRDAYNVFKKSWDDSKIELVEQFKVMLTNRANRVLGIYELSTGGIAGTVADPKLIFAAAIKAGATGIILSHNHPSGNLAASHTDVTLTKKIREGAKILDIELLDHLIITSEAYSSFADEGML
jgi:DNA repair protein RadC